MRRWSYSSCRKVTKWLHSDQDLAAKKLPEVRGILLNPHHRAGVWIFPPDQEGYRCSSELLLVGLGL